MQKPTQIALGVILLVLVGVTAAPAQPAWQGLDIVRLAERGNARAQTRLGFLFATGRGVPQITPRRPIGIYAPPSRVTPTRNTSLASVSTWPKGFLWTGCRPTNGSISQHPARGRVTSASIELECATAQHRN